MTVSSETRPPAPAEAGAADVLDSSVAGSMAIRGSVVRAAGYGGAMLLSLVSAPLLVRHLGIVQYGRYMTVLALVALVATITDGGLMPLGVREYTVRSGTARDDLLRNLLGVRVFLTVVGLAIALGFGLLAGYDTTLILGTVVAGAGLVIGVIQTTYTVALSAALRLGAVTAVDLAKQAVMTVLLVALILTAGGLLSFWAVTVPAAFVSLALTLRLVHGASSLRPALDFAAWRSLLSQTLPVAAVAALSGIYFRLLILLMSIVAAPTETGYFSASYRIIEVLIVVPYLLVSGTFPILARAARDDRARLSYSLGRVSRVALIGGVLLALAVATGAPIAIDVLGGRAAAPAIPVLRIQAFALAPAFLSVAFAHGLFALRRHRELVVANAVAIAATLGLALVLIPSYGARGTAIAAVAGELVLMGASGLWLLRTLPDARPSLSLLGRVALGAAAAEGATLAAGGLPDIVRVLVACTVFAALMLSLRVVPAEVMEALVPAGWRLSSRGRARRVPD